MIRHHIARIAARYMSRHRVLSDRERIHAKTRQLCREMNRPIPKALRGLGRAG